MGATNSTVNYNLSQFIGSDKPAWLQDYNGDMLKIDTGINAAKLAADSAANAASAAQNDATTALGDISTINGTLSTISSTLGTAVGNINTINSLIGNGTPTTTDQTIIGAINELHANQGDLSNLATTDKTSLVGAINEIAGSNTKFDTSIALDSNLYTATSDGYAVADSGNTAGQGNVYLYGSDAVDGTEDHVVLNATYISSQIINTVYVKKGMKMKAVNTGNGTAVFKPLKA